MEIKLVYEGFGAAFKATNKAGHELTIDGSPALGGEEKGPRPMEMVLFGLAGCAAMDVLHILRKGRKELKHGVIIAHGERAEATPAVFRRVHLSFELGGDDLTERQAQRAIELSLERYCSVARMLAPHVEITSTLRLI